MSKEKIMELIREEEGFEDFLNSVRAEGASMVETRIMACIDEFAEHVTDIVEECASIAANTALELRSGTHDTADKVD